MYGTYNDISSTQFLKDQCMHTIEHNEMEHNELPVWLEILSMNNGDTKFYLGFQTL